MPDFNMQPKKHPMPVQEEVIPYLLGMGSGIRTLKKWRSVTTRRRR